MFKKLFPSKKVESEEYIKVNKKNLLKAIEKVANSKREYVTVEELGDKDLVDRWNKMLDALCNNHGRCPAHLGLLNTTLENLTSMDFAKELIEDVREQKSTMESMNASCNELASSINEIAESAQKVASSSEGSLQNAQKGLKDINEVFNFVERSFSEIYEVNAQIQKVMEAGKKIEKITEIVEDIAEKTNMLSLNAAIESVRVGEAGRGFAVVAEEVRNLAENTKVSVVDIGKNISLLEAEVKSSVEKINEVTSRLDEGKNLTKKAVNSIEKIIAASEEVNALINQVAANTEEQNAVTEEFTNSINNLLPFAEKLMSEAERTGKAIFDVSKMCDNLKLEILSDENVKLSFRELLELCKTDHLMWRWRIYNMLLGFEKVDIDQVGTHRTCRLGKWYYTYGIEKLKDDQTFIGMEKPHEELHELAKEAIIAYNNGNIKRAEEALRGMDECSRIIVDSIDRIIEKYYS